MNQKQIDKCLDENLSKFTVSPKLHQFLQGIPYQHTARTHKLKPTLLIAALVCLLSASAIAAVLTLLQSVKEPADQMSVILSQDSWSLTEKLQLIDMMIYLGYEMDDSELQMLRDTDAEALAREQAADHLIKLVYGEQLQSKLEPSVLQQTETLKPDMETVFRELCLHVNPEASDNEVEETYQAWLLDHYKSDTEVMAEADISEADILSEAEALTKARNYLYHVMNFTQAEMKDTSVSVIREENGWMAVYEIDPGKLRDELKQEWIFSSTSGDAELWQWKIYLADNGDFVSQDEYYAYILDQLVPADAYPSYHSYEDKLRAFLHASIDEKAAFTENWKPVVDEYLQSHSDFTSHFALERDFSTEYILTRHVYGCPSKDNIDEDTAIETAKLAYLQAGLKGVTSDMIEERCAVYSLFDITNSSKPVWKVSIAFDKYSEASNYPDDHKDGYFVVIDAVTGEILNQYVQTGPDGKNEECYNADLYAEWFM